MEYKKLYETVVSSRASSQQISKSLIAILKLSMVNSIHFEFLLEKVPWFAPQFSQHFAILQKILRIYQAKDKSFEKMGYQMLLEGIFQCSDNKSVVEILVKLIKEKPCKRVIVQSLKENYPHQARSVEDHQYFLSMLFKVFESVEQLKIDILEIIFQNMALMDTEYHQIKGNSKSKDDEYNGNQQLVYKLDENLCMLARFLKQNITQTSSYKLALSAFERTLLLVEKTKNLDLLFFALSESRSEWAKLFAIFLLGDTFQKYRDKRPKSVFRIVLSFLTSYLCCSQALPWKIKNALFISIKNHLIKEVQSQNLYNPRNSCLEDEKMENYHFLAFFEAFFSINKCFHGESQKQQSYVQQLVECLKGKPKCQNILSEILKLKNKAKKEYLQQPLQRTCLMNLGRQTNHFLRQQERQESKIQEIKVELKVQFEMCEEGEPSKKVKKQREVKND